MNPTLRENPFVGPVAFREKDSRYFFGRNWELNELFSSLAADRIVLLHAPSGAGKSSLIEAGLRSRLKAEGFVVLPTARVNEEPPSNPKPMVDAQGEIPFNRYLHSLLSSLLARDQAGERQMDQARLEKLSLTDYLADTASQGHPSRRVLILDQFEEIVTTAPADRDGKEAFFKQLGQALYDPYLSALFVIRDDYLGALGPYQNFLPTQLKNTFRLELLGEEAALEAIQKPLLDQGVTFVEDADHQLVDDLRKVMQQKPSGEWEQGLAGQYVEPVQLQVVCRRLYNKLNLANDLQKNSINKADVTDLGDVDHALGEFYAEEVAKAAQPSPTPDKKADQAESALAIERQIRQWFDRQLITKNRSRGQVMLESGSSGGLNNDIIDRLVDSHLVRAEKRHATWYELAHDRLVDPVRRNNAVWFKDHLLSWQIQADEWQVSLRPDAVLLTGKDLSQAEAWAKLHPGDLGETDREFLQNSRASVSEQASRAAIWRWVKIAGGVVVLVVVLGFLQFVDSRNSRLQSALNSRKLANLYGFVSANHSRTEGLGKLMNAIRSGEIAVDSKQDDANGAHHALYQALSVTGGQRLVASWSGSEPGEPLNLLKMDDDQHWLAGAGAEGPIYLWNLDASPTPTMPVTLAGGAGPATDLEFIDLAGSKLAAGFESGRVLLWDLEQPKKPPLVLRENNGRVNALESGGIWLAAGSTVDLAAPDDKSSLVTLWNMACPDIVALDLDLTALYPTPAEAQTTELGLALLDDAVNDLDFDLFGSMLLAGGAHDQAVEGESTALLAEWNLSGIRDCPAPALPAARRLELSTPPGFNPDPEQIDQISPPLAAITMLAINPARPQVALAFEDYSRWLSSTEKPGEILPLPVTLGELLPETRPVLPVDFLEFDPPRDFLISAREENLIYFWRYGDLDAYLRDPNIFPFPQGQVTDAAVTSHSSGWLGRWLVSGMSNGLVQMWDLASDLSAPEISTVTGLQGPITAVAASPGGSLAASAGQDGSVRLWDLSTTSPAAAPLVLSPKSGDFYFGEAGQFSSNSAISDGGVFLFPPPGSRTFDPPEDQAGYIVEVGQSAALSGMDLDTVAGVGADEYLLSPQADWLAAVKYNGDVDGGPPLLKLFHRDPQESAVDLEETIELDEPPALKLFDPQGKWLLLHGQQSGTKLFSLAGGRVQPFEVFMPAGPVLSAAFSPDGRWLALGGSEGRGAVWNLANLAENATQPAGKPNYEFTTADRNPICALAFRPEQTRKIASINSLEWTTTHRDQLLAIAVIPGKVFTWDPDHTEEPAVELDLLSNEMARDEVIDEPQPTDAFVDIGSTPDPCQDFRNRLAFSSDGRWLAVAPRSGPPGHIYMTDLFINERKFYEKAVLWLTQMVGRVDLQERPVWSARPQLDPVKALGFDPDSRWLFAGGVPLPGDDSGLGLLMWSLADLDNPAAVLNLPATAGGVNELAFSDNGWLIARSPNAVVRMWRLDLQELGQLACQTLARAVGSAELRRHLRAENWPEGSAGICDQTIGK